MSVFDQSFYKPSGCFGICDTNMNGNNGDRLSPNPSLQNPLHDDLMTPADREKKREIDNMLSQAMKGLTFEERQEQQEILHGVDEKIAEEETFIEASLQQLESHLAQIKTRTVYEMAEQRDPAYVRARAFRIMFLRGNRYNAKESAENMLRFFEMKCTLFGEEKLVKDIKLEDLDEGDIAALKSGFLQLAGRDRSGRILLLNLMGLRGKNVTLKNEMRMRFYMLMNALEKEENQLSSFISIAYSVGNMQDPFGGSGLFEHSRLATAIPKYMAAVHLCTDEVGEYLIQATIIKAATSLQMKSRIQLHFGSQTECLYKLSTFGIPQKFLPLDPNTGQISLKRHLEWVESQFAMEGHNRRLPTTTHAASANQGITTHPGENDVLVGTGRKSNNMGNKRLRAFVKELSQAYDKGTKEERKELVDCVINSIKQEAGGRFLKEHRNIDNGDIWNTSSMVIWKEMPKDQIRRIVTQAFRNSYRRR